MQEEIKDLINAIRQEDASRTQDVFHSIMAQKTMSSLNDMRKDVAASMFNVSKETE